MRTKMKSRRPIESSQCNGIRTRILTTPKKQKKFLRKLARLIQSCQIKINVQFSTNTAKRDLTHQQHHNSEISKALEEVTLTLIWDLASVMLRLMNCSGEHSEGEIRLRVSSETTMTIFSETSVSVSNRTTLTIDSGSKEMTHSAALAEDSSMMMISLIGVLETWVVSVEASLVLLFQAVEWVARVRASKRQL